MTTHEQRQRLRWKRKPFPELARLAWPIAVSMLSYSTMTLVDTLFVSRLGASQLAAAGLGGVAAFTWVCFGFGLLRSVKVLVSQAVGAGRDERVPEAIGAGVLLALLLGVILSLGAFFSADLVGAISAAPEAGAGAAEYLSIRALGTPLFLVAVALREGRYGVGDSRTPMLVTVFANVANIGLDYLFIFGLDLGLAGAAWATVVAVSLEAVLLAALSRDALRALGRVRSRDVAAVFKLGLPLGAQMLLEVGSFSLLTALIATMGELDLAAHQIALQVLHVSFLPAVAIGEASSVLVGQAVGADEDQLVVRVSRQALLLTFGYIGVCATVFIAFPTALAGAFTSDPALIDVVVPLLYLGGVFQLFDGVNIIARSSLRGTGDVRIPAILNVGLAWLSTPPLTWAFGIWLGMGALGGWIGLSTEIALGAGLLWWRLERKHWVVAAKRSREELTASPATATDEAPASVPQPAE